MAVVDGALDAADMIEIGDDLFAGAAGDGRDDHGVARRHLEHLARKLPPVGEHVAAENRNLHALEPRQLSIGSADARVALRGMIGQHRRRGTLLIL